MGDSIIKLARENWVFVMFAGTLVVGWTQFDGRVTAVEVEQTRQAAAISGFNNSLSDLQRDVAKAAEGIDFIKNYLINK